MQPITLSLSNITFTYPTAGSPLFAQVNCTFPQGWTAVLGDNGIGKSTLMAIARGKLRPDSGQVSPNNLVLSYCPQDIAVRPVNLEDFAADWQSETIRLRERLGIEDDWAYRYDTLSGGERKRLQIACALAQKPDVLILDEPTNHVDEPTQQAIIEVMRNYQGIGIVVSHDVTLIDATCTRCIMFERRHVNGRNLTEIITYQGNYSQAAQQKHCNDRAASQRLADARKEISRLESAQSQRFAKVQQVEAAKQHGERINPKDHDARNRRNLAKMTGLDAGASRSYAQLNGRLAKVRQTGEAISTASKRYDGNIWLNIEPSSRCELIRLKSEVIPFDEQLLPEQLKDKSLTVAAQSSNVIRLNPPQDGEAPQGVKIPLISIGPRDHLAIIGPNGAGKTTLIRAMIDAAIDIPMLVIQQNTTLADTEQAMTLLHGLSQADKSMVLSAYAQLNADPDRLLQGEVTSPGELRKLLLCLGLVSKPQLIVMDEPTNHLDLNSKVAFARTLGGYPGALIIVSHDDWFVRQLTAANGSH
ncbi:ABC-F family ATP-binding cassette domain-containing protein [Bifidobacterium imperatoris]|uniref:ABC transporter n=2 Tax=Bifidobacterium imperatoris TaxID=2020965 RepID=A0A2N5IUC6_9BIFI|nr:ATP-binding cassette domain-containing protein [Bifidobacterium imperatoris]PLS25537.1 ABC transporter [Bifidobacterium imperatoris]QSY57106.1 ABC-F family ATP-binding cassette domain-containing protein [Bifidobacterium imperatoris]